MQDYIISRGEVYWIESKTMEVGAEIKKTRPAVVISNNNTNRFAPLITVAYMTTAPKIDSPSHVVTKGTSYGKCEGSTILCEQINTVSKTRIQVENGYLGRISDEEMDAIDKAIADALALEITENADRGNDDYYEDDGYEDDGNWEEMERLRIERDFYKNKYDEVLDKLMAKI